MMPRTVLPFRRAARFAASFLALLTVLAAAGPARAQEGGGEDFIESADVRPGMQEMEKKFIEAQRGVRRKEDVFAEYSLRAADEKASPRDRAEALFLYGHLLVRGDRQEDAVVAWGEALTRYPRFPDAHVALGRLALATRDERMAKRHAKAALEIHPKHFHALVLQGEIAMAQGDLTVAETWFNRALDRDPTHTLAVEGYCQVLVLRFRETFNAERKAELAKKARSVADTWVAMAPDELEPRLLQARVYLGLEQPAEAAEKLEAALRELSTLGDGERAACYFHLYRIHEQQQDLDGAIGALRRLVAVKSLPPAQKEKFGGVLATLEEKGASAFLAMRIKVIIDIMANRGQSATVRRDAMRDLQKLLTDPKFLDNPALEDVIQDAWRACVRTLRPPTPPELAIDMMQFLRLRTGDAALLRLVVHFVGPKSADSDTTEAVRVEATRTLAEVGGLAAVPSLLYTLKDDSLRVTRATDQQLCRLLERRSMIAPGAGPVSQDEQLTLRRGWHEWMHGEEGNRRLTEALQELRDRTAKDRRFNRQQTENPLADHVVSVILLDNDLGFEAWEAGYLFLVDFLGREFLPAEHRGKVVTPELRPVAAAEIKKWYFGETKTQKQDDEQKGSESVEDPASKEASTTTKPPKKNSGEKG